MESSAIFILYLSLICTPNYVAVEGSDEASEVVTSAKSRNTSCYDIYYREKYVYALQGMNWLLETKPKI